MQGAGKCQCVKCRERCGDWTRSLHARPRARWCMGLGQ